MKIIARSDIGKVRQTNEDAFLVCEEKDDFIAFVCDGMGGHLGGSLASGKTVELLAKAFEDLEKSKTNKKIATWLFENLTKINQALYDYSKTNDNLRGMGTTVSGVIKYQGEIYYAHIGDSRVYLYDNENIDQITTDHTYVNSLLLNGLITPHQALHHPKRHVITNALGIKRDLSVDIGKVNLKENSNIFICSDGVHNLLDGKKLLKILNLELDHEEKADAIKDKILELGASDNFTFIMLEK